MLALGASVAGAGMSAIGAIQQGREAQRQGAAQQYASYANAAQADLAAKTEREDAEARYRDYLRDNSRALASLRAARGGSGVEVSGSVLAAEVDRAREVAVEALRIRAGGERRASQAETEAGFARMAGDNYARAGAAAMGSARWAAGASLLGGIGGAAMNYASLPK